MVHESGIKLDIQWYPQNNLATTSESFVVPGVWNLVPQPCGQEEYNLNQGQLTKLTLKDPSNGIKCFAIHWELVQCSSVTTRAILIETGWWFGTFFIFPCIGNNHPNWLISFQRGWNHQPENVGTRWTHDTKILATSQAKCQPRMESWKQLNGQTVSPLRWVYACIYWTCVWSEGSGFINNIILTR